MIIDGRFVDDRLINRLMGECTALASDCRRLSRLPNRDNQAVKAMIPLLKNIRDRDAEWWFRNGSEIKQSLAGVRAMLLVEVIPEEPVPVEPEASDEVVTPVGVVEVSRKPGEDGVFGTKDDEVVIRARRDDGVDVQLRGEDLVRARLAEIGALEGMAVADVAQRREYARLQRIGAGRDGGWWRRNECFLLGKLDELEASLRANELPMLA